MWIAATVSCERERRKVPSRRRPGPHLASTHITRGPPCCNRARIRQRTHRPGGAESAPPSLRRNRLSGGGGQRSGAGSGRRAPLGPAGVPARPRARAGPAQPRSPAHRAVTGGSAPLPVTGPCSPMPCQITRGTAVAAKPRRSPSSSTTAALNAAILTEHMTRARHRSGVEGAAWRGRDQTGAGSVLKGGGSSLGRGLDGRGVV